MKTTANDFLPERIVSLAPSITEIIFALGAEDKLVGVTAYCQYPPKVIDLVRARKLRTIGGYSKPKLERVTDLKPDMVIATKGHQNAALDTLREGGLKVSTFDYPKTIEELFQNIFLLGKILGLENGASSLINALRRRVESVKESARLNTPRTVFFELSDEPLRTVSGKIWIGDLVRTAGGVNVFEDREEAFPVVDFSEVRSCNPEIIIVAVQRSGEQEKVYEMSGWKEIRAIREKKVFGVDADIAEKPTPRAIDLLEIMSQFLV